ncbi:MAG TPA: hypothetical protein VF772_01040, partial [Terriglobales bacterium]
MGGIQVEKIKVNKTELLSILESNRSKHRQIFEESCDDYQKAVKSCNKRTRSAIETRQRRHPSLNVH